MSNLLVPLDNSFWYDELGSAGFYGETEFQKAIQQHVTVIFPDYFTIPFGKIIKSKLGTSKPDLALISKSLKEWWIIEVELGKHSLEKHVLKQIDDFLLGNYPETIYATYFKKQLEKIHGKTLDEKAIKKMLQKSNPKILVIVDEEKTDWVAKLEKRKVNLCLFQVFKNATGRHAYRLNGSYPYIITSESHCKPDNFFGNNLLEVRNPKVISGTKAKVSIRYLEQETLWQKFTDKKKTYLRFLGKINPLPPNSSFALVQDSRKKLLLIKN